jgi:hypothetical protein
VDQRVWALCWLSEVEVQSKDVVQPSLLLFMVTNRVRFAVLIFLKVFLV